MNILEKIDLYIDSHRIMRLRTNKVLKLFALLLFSWQFMASAIIIDLGNSGSNQDKVQLIDDTNHQNILYTLFTEEVTETEEGREGQKEIIIFNDFDFAYAFLQLLATEPAACKLSSLISERFDTQPSLFKLNCTFLI